MMSTMIYLGLGLSFAVATLGFGLAWFSHREHERDRRNGEDA